MYEKSALNELTLRSEGTVAVGLDPPVVLLDPHAAMRSAKTVEHAASAGRRNRANLIWTSCPGLDVAIPAVFFPVRRGESAPAAGVLSPCGERLIRRPTAEH